MEEVPKVLAPSTPKAKSSKAPMESPLLSDVKSGTSECKKDTRHIQLLAIEKSLTKDEVSIITNLEETSPMFLLLKNFNTKWSDTKEFGRDFNLKSKISTPLTEVGSLLQNITQNSTHMWQAILHLGCHAERIKTGIRVKSPTVVQELEALDASIEIKNWAKVCTRIYNLNHKQVDKYIRAYILACSLESVVYSSLPIECPIFSSDTKLRAFTTDARSVAYSGFIAILNRLRDMLHKSSNEGSTLQKEEDPETEFESVSFAAPEDEEPTPPLAFVC